MPRLRRVDCTAPGITRKRAGRGFAYYDENGARITDPETLARIRNLTIPPAWTDVWICPHPNGHIQATGIDARGRRQYRYHDRWRRRRDQQKFDHMLEFARALPLLRERCAERLASDGDLTRDRVLACATRLLDLGFFRIGSEGYAEENQTFGLATIRKEHVTVTDEVVTFDYPAKGGKRRIQSVVDPDVAEVVRALKRRRAGGRELLAHRENGRWTDVRSPDINAYVKEITGGDFSAKDFRTWNATVLAAVALGVSTGARTKTARKRAVARAMQEVGHYLGNTAAIVRSSYVDPRVVDRYNAGHTIRPALDAIGEGAAFGNLSTQGRIEEAVLDLLAEEETESAGAAA